MTKNIYNNLPSHMLKKIYSSYTHPSYMLERELIGYIKLTDEYNALETLKRINLLERASLSDMPINSLKYSLIGSCTIFTRAIIEAGVDSELAFMVSDLFINEIDKTTYIENIRDLEYTMLTEFIKILKSNKEYIYSPLINKSISYVKKNIDSKFTIKELSNYLKIHPNYLSSIFVKEVGINLSEYISKQKIHSIKHFLTESSISLSEIAYIFNFSSQAHFSKFFKDNAGVSPLKYRKLFSINN